MKTLNYTYNTPEEAIASLERAYTNNDLEGVFNSKDFIEEAKIILNQAKYEYDITDELLLEETAKLLQLGLTQSLKENGFPNFTNSKVEVYGLKKVSETIYVVNEKITYPDETFFENRIFLSCKNEVWKVVTIEE